MKRLKEYWKYASTDKKVLTVLPFVAAADVLSVPLQINLFQAGINDMTEHWWTTWGTYQFYGLLGVGAFFDFADVLSGATLLGYAGYGLYKGARHFLPPSDY